ncbi:MULTISPECIES: hypothetical protein [Mycolicibacterium]|uniref:hypothetical protein n=1 Tax=Mycolicibacterium TaxID=1866885 RepID=UPI0013D8C005|nr:hypothetical protein [Mycolicibacterium chitae]MCV7108042.1 hypothetical protein [Mycolicibacterium chitae]
MVEAAAQRIAVKLETETDADIPDADASVAHALRTASQHDRKGVRGSDESNPGNR